MSSVNAQKIAEMVRDAGGRVIGRTRLQKMAFLLSEAGFLDGFTFTYKHYGPFSEHLAVAALDANLLKLIKETENQASWGGFYSTYVSNEDAPSFERDSEKQKLLNEIVNSDAIVLELAATALYLSKNGFDKDAWAETKRRKPEKANSERLEQAKEFYNKLVSMELPKRLPPIIN